MAQLRTRAQAASSACGDASSPYRFCASTHPSGNSNAAAPSPRRAIWRRGPGPLQRSRDAIGGAAGDGGRRGQPAGSAYAPPTGRAPANLIAGAPSRGAMASSAACRLCGRSFELRGRASALFCKSCNDKADREVGRAAAVQCGECGKEFTTRTRCTKYCSDACRIEARRRHGRENMRRYMSDPEKRAVAIARQRAQFAARRGAAPGGARGQSRPAGIRRAAPRPSMAAPPSPGHMQAVRPRL